MPNQGKVQQEDGHAFSSTDTKIRYRTENSGSPLEHAQVDANFEVLRKAANGLVEDIEQIYNSSQINKASVASLESRASELETNTGVNANDIAVNGVKIADNLVKIEILNVLTGALGVDTENNENAIATNAAAILNLDTKTTDNHTALEVRVSNNESQVETLVTSDATNTENIASLTNDLSIIGSGAMANESDINTNKGDIADNKVEIANLKLKDIEIDGRIDDQGVLIADIDDRLTANAEVTAATALALDHFLSSDDITDGLTLPAITSAIDQAALAVVSNDEDIAALQERATAIESSITTTQTNIDTVQENVTSVETNVGSGPGYLSGNALVNEGTGTENTTVTLSDWGVPSDAKWGVFWTYNAGNDWPNHATYVFPNSSFTNGAMVFYNNSDKSQYGGVQFMAPVVDGKCYIKSQESSTDSWKLYLHGWI